MKRGKKWKRILVCVLMVAVFFSASAFSLKGQETVKPENPMQEMQEDTNAGKASALASYLPQSEKITAQTQGQDAVSSEAQAEQEQKDEDSKNVSEKEQGGKDGNNVNGGSGGENGESGTDAGKIKDGDGDAQNFFTTSIIDGEVVTKQSYSFTVTQLQHEIPLKEMLVFVNDRQMPQFNGKVPLEEGNNIIKITCSYQKRGEKAFSVSRSYKVILDTKNIVFFTNLEAETAVNSPYFSFIAYAQYKGENIPLTVKLNDSVCEQSAETENTYDVMLKEQTNTILLEAKTSDGKVQTQSHTVRLSLKEAYILTDLDRVSENEMTKSKLTFYASVMDKGSEKEHPVRVTMNGRELDAPADFTYKVSLEEGANTFVIDGSSFREGLTETYVVYYYAPAEGLEIRTDLEAEQTVNDPSFIFYAYARDNQSKVDLSVEVNGRKVEGNRNHYYSVGLKKNDNSIVLTADNGVDKKVQEYIVTYEPKNASDAVEEEPDKPEEEDPCAPGLSSPDLYDGMVVKGSIKNVTLKASDYQGRHLNAGHMTLKLNGRSSGISLIWDDSSKTSYRLRLASGENELSIKVVDDEGHKKTFLVNIISQDVGEGGVIGKARFSIDAQVLGLGYLIEPTDVEIHDGENAAYVIDRFLRENGFTYNYTGSLKSGFYLARINKKGLLKNLSDSMRQEYAGKFDENSLGEFDFNHMSGWMYSVDGDFPNYGFADSYLQDGAEVRIQFTLAYGDDIGGGEAMGKSN